MSTIIRAVNINLHPTGNGNITPIILSCDRDNTAVEGSKDGASYFLAAYYTGLFGAWRWINHFNMALVEGAIRCCSLRLIKSETLSLLPWHPFERAEGEDEMLNISGLCLPAAAEQSESLLPIATFVYSSSAVRAGPRCVWVSVRLSGKYFFKLQINQKTPLFALTSGLDSGQNRKHASHTETIENDAAGVVQKPIYIIHSSGHAAFGFMLPSWRCGAAVIMFQQKDHLSGLSRLNTRALI